MFYVFTELLSAMDSSIWYMASPSCPYMLHWCQALNVQQRQA